MAAEAAFKDIPEIFEVRICQVYYPKKVPVFNITPGRVGGVPHGTNRGPWCASNQISSSSLVVALGLLLPFVYPYR
jgi:hypothetical protein